MSVISQQVTKTPAAKQAPARSGLMVHVRGLAGNHTMLERDKAEREVSTASRKTPQSLKAAVLRTFGRAGLTVPIRPDAETLGAAGMTVHGEVNLAPGRLDDHSAKGISLLGHEIGHALQQNNTAGGGDSVSTGRRASLEAEARAAGNALARGERFIVQERAPANVAFYDDPTHSDIQQWEDDWNDSAFAGHRSDFAGSDRPVGTPKHRYDVLCPLYFAQGIRRPLQFVANNIVTGHFFHFSTPVHRDLVVPLQNAEAVLRPAGFLATKLTKFWGFNARTTSRGLWSNHADGRAVDIDQETNPHLDNKEHRRVISAVTGLDIEAAIPGADQGMLDTYAGVELASFLFQVRYNEPGLKDALERLGELLIDEGMRVSFHQKALRDFPTTGLTSAERAFRRDIESDLKRARARHADLLKDIQAVRSELNRFTRQEAGIARAELKLEDAEAQRRFLEAAINTATPDEARALTRRVPGAERSIARSRKALDDARKKKESSEPGRFAETGFLTLPRILVEVMKSSGFQWGGEIWPEHKDLMHFQIT